MLNFYNPVNDIKEPIFRKLNIASFDELLEQLTPNEDLICVFAKDDIKVAPYINSKDNFNNFMSGIKSGHFTSHNFYATQKKVIIQSPFRPPSLNLSFCNLTIEQRIILPNHICKVEKETEERRLAAIELRNEVRKEDGIEPGFTPTIGNSGESIKIKSRSNSTEGIKKNVSFKDILTEEFLFDTNDLVNDSLSTLENSTEQISF
jgi:hypothetical protein